VTSHASFVSGPQTFIDRRTSPFIKIDKGFDSLLDHPGRRPIKGGRDLRDTIIERLSKLDVDGR
jgi:hypothetical protein